MQKNKILKISIVAGFLIGAAFLGVSMFQSRFELALSENPEGYFSIEIKNRDSYQVSSLDFELLIVNSSIIATYNVVNGVIVGGSGNSTGILYSYSQSYAVIVGNGFKSQTIPIECSEYEEDAMVNVINAIKLVLTSDVSVEVNISRVNDEYPHYSYENWNPSGYAVEEGAMYSASIKIGYEFLAYDAYTHYIGTKAWTIGDFNILPDCVLQHYAKYSITNTLGVTNYEAHFFVMDAIVQNVSSSLPGLIDPTVFNHEAHDYTSIKIDPVATSCKDETILIAYYHYEFQFNATSSGILSYCIFDGALDAAFDPAYAYYKIGGF